MLNALSPHSLRQMTVGGEPVPNNLRAALPEVMAGAISFVRSQGVEFRYADAEILAALIPLIKPEI